jgi:hypothetical protein
MEEEEEDALAPGAVTVTAPPVENRRPAPGSLNRTSPTVLDTSATQPLALEAPGSECADTSYVLLDTPRATRELRTTKPDPPITLLRSAMYTLREEPEDGDDD